MLPTGNLIARTTGRVTRWLLLAVIWMWGGMALLPAAPASAAPAAAPAGLTSREVAFRGTGGVALHGTVLAPAAAGARRPAMVMLHGSGPVTQEEFRAEAEALARRGIVTLIFDKRTSGYSFVQRDYPVLAGDALTGVQVLKARADVDPGRIGL